MSAASPSYEYCCILNLHRFDNNVPSNNCANWASEGLVLSDRPGFLKFFARAMAQFVAYQVRQVPGNAELQVDYPTLLSAFSILDESGTRIHPGDWDLHPGSSSVSSEFGVGRDHAEQQWCDHKRRREAFLPFAAHHGEWFVPKHCTSLL